MTGFEAAILIVLFPFSALAIIICFDLPRVIRLLLAMKDPEPLPDPEMPTSVRVRVDAKECASLGVNYTLDDVGLVSVPVDFRTMDFWDRALIADRIDDGGTLRSSWDSYDRELRVKTPTVEHILEAIRAENKAERERDAFSHRIADAIKGISLERLRDMEIYAKSRSEEKDAENHKYPDNWSDVHSKLIRLRMALSD